MNRHFSKMLAVLLFWTTAPIFGQKGNNDIEKIGRRDINKDRPLVSDLRTEMAMGREWARELEKRGIRLHQDPVVAEYASRIGNSIAKSSDATTLFTIKVVDSTAINALALPGDFLYINAGLILTAANEAELAAIMAHFIAHITARHASETEARGAIGMLSGPPPSMLMSPSSVPTLPVLFYKFMRQSEEEADWLGVQYLYKAGYDPSAMAGFFENLTIEEAAQKVSPLFSTHPQNARRIAKVNENINRYLPKRQQHIVTTTEFQDVKARVMQRTQ